MTSLTPPSVLLVAGSRETTFARAMEDRGSVVVRAPSVALSLDFARAIHPDAIIIECHDGDASAVDLCGKLRRDLEIGPDIPILMLLNHTPSPDVHVAGLRAGVWDYLRSSDPFDEAALKIETYVQARRNGQSAVANGLHRSGALQRPDFTQRLRELGALMGRMHGALTCVVLSMNGGPGDGTEAAAVARLVRASDVVGSLNQADVALVAPATEVSGAVSLIRRVAAGLREFELTSPVMANGSLRAGYATVANMKYEPVNPLELLSRAVLAVTAGAVNPSYPWIRQGDAAQALQKIPALPEPSIIVRMPMASPRDRRNDGGDVK